MRERLRVNPDWSLKPIDNFVEEFIWKYLVQLTNVNWYELESPVICPRIFSTWHEYSQAIDLKEFDVCTVNTRVIFRYKLIILI